MSQRASSIRRILRHAPRFVAFVYARFPLARLALLLTLFATLVEYATFSLMLPLSGQKAGTSAILMQRFWSMVTETLGFTAGPQSWLLLFLVLLAFRTGLEFFLVWANTLLSKQVHAHLSNSLFSQVVQREPLANIYTRSIGHYISIAGDDTSRAGNIILYFGQLLAALLDAAVGFLLLFVFSHAVFLATVVFCVLSALFVAILIFFLMRLNFRTATQSRALNTHFMDALNGIRSLRSMDAEAYVVSTYRDYIRRYLKGLLDSELLKQGMKSGPALLLLAIGIAMAWPGTGITNQDREPLYFVALTMLLLRVFVAMGTVVTKGERLVSDIRAAHDVDELLANEDVAIPRPEHRRVSESVRSIEFSGLACGYVAGAPVLTGVGGRFVAGRVYAVVGESGSGKSTLADVILGLLQPIAGHILVNGRPVEPAEWSGFRHGVVLVEQNTRIFTGTLRDNILLGHDTEPDSLSEAVALSALDSFTAGVSGGLDFPIEYQGANLSGGQRQRIGIARALVRSPDVLILDEATSALDQGVRDKVLNGVKARMSGKILILITHDLEVASLADELWRVESGGISIAQVS